MSEIEKQQELRSRIEEEMKPSEGWWRSDTAESFNQVANKLIAGGSLPTLPPTDSGQGGVLCIIVG